MKSYRQLYDGEIERLIAAGNGSDDWTRVSVAEDFTPEHIERCRFSGRVRLGRIDGSVVSPAGVERRARLQGCEFIDCDLADRVFVSGVRSYIANYNICSGAYISDVGVMQTTGESSFGNGVQAAVINEAGGREVTLTDVLTSQTAYLTAVYRHRSKLVEKLCALSGDHARSVASVRGTVGEGACIEGCGEITNVRIGPEARLTGAVQLVNGTVNSSPEARTRVGAGVMARDFVFAEGARVDTGACLERCYVGEGVRTESGFAAADSIFFANSFMANGEACSIFAGPFTVSHHRSTLLIAGMFSFFNAGSGSNQSNHLFRSGPVHQGLHERGCKTGSDSYIMLPAREGAFTTVIGRHFSHHDTGDFPFSHLIQEEGRSFLMPGAGLRSHGMVRDMAKWPRRDVRTGPRRDMISFEAYNPYLGERMMRAVERCEALLETDMEVYAVDRVRIRKTMLRRGLDLYRRACKATLGFILSNGDGCNANGDGCWVDIGGMYAPQGLVERLCDDVERGSVGSLAELQARFEALHEGYVPCARGWAMGRLRAALGREPSAEEVETAVREGIAEMEHLARLAEEDGARDSEGAMTVSYGADASADCGATAKDFIAVRRR